MSTLDSLSFFYPEIMIIAGAFLTLTLDFFLKNKKALGGFGLIVLAAAAFFARMPDKAMPLFDGFFMLDSFTHFFRLAAYGIVAITILFSVSYKPLSKNQGEFYSLLLFMTLGLTLMASSTHLLMIFLAIEFVSIVSYILVGYQKKDARSKEAAIKYLLFGSIASSLMLFGMSLLFGASGAADLARIQPRLLGASFYPLAMFGTLLFLGGIGFKISMAPFHFWAPDVYEGAPTPVTAFLTVAPKALGFAVLVRLFTNVYPWFGVEWTKIISLLAILTMTVGNITAIAQHNIKRLLAYSSIAQAGYILMGIAAASKMGLEAILVYVLAYAFTNLGAFAVVLAAFHTLGSDSLEAYRGLGKRSPFLAAALTVFLLSLAGMPPLAGFIGKFLVFSSAIESGLITLAVIAALNSAVAAYYYFKIVRTMYLVPAEQESPLPFPKSLWFALIVLLVGTVVMGILPEPVLALVRASL